MTGLRYFINNLQSEGDLKLIDKEVDWKYEIGEISRSEYKGDNKALLFVNIKDYPSCKVFTNGLGSQKRIAISLGLEKTTSWQEIVKKLKNGIRNPISPRLIATGEFHKKVSSGGGIDFGELPVPLWSPLDGGRYIGTWHLNISKDPISGKRNLGIYRMQIVGKDQLAVSASPNSHLAHHMKISESRGDDLEMAIAIGVDESLILAAATAVPREVDEYGISGGITGKSVDITKCQDVSLEVPSSAEIVIEGKILSRARIKEGPFLDYAGIPKSNPGAYLFQAKSVFHDKNYIFRGATVGGPGAEDHLVYFLVASAGYLDFHGSFIRQKIQNMLLQNRKFAAFQKIGRIGDWMRGANGRE